MTAVLIANIAAVIDRVTVKITLAYHFAVFIVGGFYLVYSNRHYVDASFLSQKMEYCYSNQKTKSSGYTCMPFIFL